MANAGERRQLSPSVATDGDLESDFERKLRSAVRAHHLDLRVCGWGVLNFVVKNGGWFKILVKKYVKSRS